MNETNQTLVHEMIVTQLSRSLEALKNCIKSAQKFAAERNFKDEAFLTLKAAPDMFPFVRQVQIATDNAKGAVARLSGKTAPAFEDNETTMEQLLSRIDKTIQYMAEFKPEDFKNYKDKEIRFPWYPGCYLKGGDYFESHLIPNFYFHFTTAYILLRNAGVPLGKKDFLGNQNWLKDA